MSIGIESWPQIESQIHEYMKKIEGENLKVLIFQIHYSVKKVAKEFIAEVFSIKYYSYFNYSLIFLVDVQQFIGIFLR